MGTSKQTIEKRRTEGLCIRCGQGAPDEGLQSCSRCREQQARANKNYAAKVRANRLCVVCCKRPQREGMALCEVCSETRKQKNSTEEAKLKKREIDKRSRDRLRAAVYDYYGNCCACCGETEIQFLSIDHVNNNGNVHRKEMNVPMIQWLKNNDFPDGFQLLCRNCNWSKHLNGGKCIHQISLDNQAVLG